MLRIVIACLAVTWGLASGALAQSVIKIERDDGYARLKPAVSGWKGGFVVPTGTTAQRDPTPVEPLLYSNSTTNELQYWNGSSWISLGAGGGGGAFSDAADPVLLNTTTKSVVVGASQINAAKLSIDGDADEVQFSIQGHSTQTANLLTFEQSDGTDVLTLTNAGILNALTLTESGNAVPNSVDTLDFFSATSSAQFAGVISDETGSGAVVLGTSPTISTSLLQDGDVADAGYLRLQNAAQIAWESSPAGADYTLAVDASEILQASGAMNVSGALTEATNAVPNSTDNLSFFAATTSAQLAGVLSDEAGTGSIVLSTLADGNFLDLAAIIHNDTALQGFRLPQIGAAPSNPTSGEGFLGWDQTTNMLKVYDGAAWTAVDTAGGGAFSDAGDPAVLNTTTKSVQIGAAHINTAKLAIDGDADEVQFSIQGHATQTTNLITIEQSGGTDVLTLTNAGVLNATTITEGGNAVPNATDNLSFFSATTSAQLAGVLSDETGTGAAVFGTAPALSGAVLDLPQINDTSDDHQYVYAVSELVADRTVTLPLLTGDDTWVFEAHAATLTNKTINLANNTLTATSAQMATAVTDETGTGVLVFGTSPTITTSLTQDGDAADSEFLRLQNNSGIAWESSPAGADVTLKVDASEILQTSGDLNVGGALTEATNAVPNSTDHLGFFSATTSLQFAGVISDETGTGVVVLGTSPTITTSLTQDGEAADSGYLRLQNAANIAWESAPAGADYTLGVDASEILQTSGAVNVGGALTEGTNAVPNSTDHLGFFAATTSAQLLTVISDETGSGLIVGATSPTFTTSLLMGSAGVSFADDGDGQLTLLGLGDGSDENWTINLDDTANTVVHGTSTGVTVHDWGAIQVAAGSFDASDGNITNVGIINLDRIEPDTATTAIVIDSGTNEVLTLDNGTNTVSLSLSGDRLFHDTNADGVKDGGEEFIDLSGGGAEWTDLGTVLHPADLSGAEDVVIGQTAIQDAARLTVVNDGPVLSLHNTTDDVDNQVVVIRGNSRATAMDGDGAYASFVLDNDFGVATEFARIDWIGNLVEDGNEDGQLDFSVMAAGTLSTEMSISEEGVSITNVLEIPAEAAPVVDLDGEIAVDTTVTDWSHGIIKYYGGEEMAVVAMPLAELTSPTNGHVVTYNSTTDEFELAAAGAGASEWTDLGTRIHPTEPTDDVVIGRTTAIGTAILTVEDSVGVFAFSDTSDNNSVNVGTIYGNSRATAVVDDEANISLFLTDDAGSQANVVQMIWTITDITNGSQDGQLEFRVPNAGGFNNTFGINANGFQIVDGAEITAAGAPHGAYFAVNSTQPSMSLFNTTDAASNMSASFAGNNRNANAANGDEAYIIFELDDDSEATEEYARLTYEANSVVDGSEDGELRLGVMVGGTLTDHLIVNELGTTVIDAMILDDNTNTVALALDGDRIFHDTDADGTKDVGEEYIDQAGGASGMDAIHLMPADMNIASSDPAVPDLGSTQHKILFDDTTDESGNWTNIRVNNYGGGNLDIDIVYSMASATSGNVVVTGELWAITPGDAADVDTESYGTLVSVTDAVPGTAGHTGSLTLTFDSAGELDNLADGDILVVRIKRDADNASDTATLDLEIRSIVCTEQ